MLQDALGEVTKIYPPLKLRVFVDDTAFLMEKKKEVAKMAKKKVISKLKEEVEVKKRPQTISPREWKGRRER